jgi:hypothetical protein
LDTKDPYPKYLSWHRIFQQKETMDDSGHGPEEVFGEEDKE